MSAKEKIAPKFEYQSDTASLKIKMAFCHKGILVPGAILNETTLTQQKLPGAEMKLTPMGLFIRHKNQTTVIPLANVINAVVDEA